MDRRIKQAWIGTGLLALGLSTYFFWPKRSEQPAVTLRLWQTQSVDATAEWSTLLADFQKEAPHITVQVSYAGEEALQPSTEIKARPFELIMGKADTIKAFAKRQDLRPWDPGDPLIKNWTEHDLEKVKFADQIYAWPLYESDYQVLFYNLSLVSTAPQTWSDLAKSTFASSIPGQNRFGLALPEDAFAAYPFLQTSFEVGQDTLAAAQEGFSTLDELRFTFPVTPMGCHASCAARLFVEGKASYALAGEWRLKEFRAALGEKLGIAPLPKMASRPSQSIRQRYFMAEATDLSDAQRHASIALMQYLQSAKGAEAMAEHVHKVASAAVNEQVSIQNAQVVSLLRVLRESTVDLSEVSYENRLKVLDPLLKAYQTARLNADEAAHRLAETLQQASVN